MKKPLLEDYGLTKDDIEWAITRRKEIDDLSYKKFVPKIWAWLVVIGTILSTSVFASFFLVPECSQTSSCHIGDIIWYVLRMMLFMGLVSYCPSIPLAVIRKWIYKYSAKNDERLQRVFRYNYSLDQYKSHLENRSTADSPSKMELSNFSDEVTFKYDDEHGQEQICSDIDSKQRQGIEEDVLLAHDIASKKQYSNVSDDDIVSAYGDFISENHKVDLIWDVSKLPYPKEIIKDALIRVYVRENITQEKMNAIGVCFTYLSQFQEGVGDEDLSCNASGLTKLHKAHKAGHINQDQFRVLIKEELEKSEKDKVLYGKFDKVVQKEMIEILPEEFLRQTAARKVLIAIIKARKESDKKKSS